MREKNALHGQGLWVPVWGIDLRGSRVDEGHVRRQNRVVPGRKFSEFRAWGVGKGRCVSCHSMFPKFEDFGVPDLGGWGLGVRSLGVWGLGLGFGGWRVGGLGVWRFGGLGFGVFGSRSQIDGLRFTRFFANCTEQFPGIDGWILGLYPRIEGREDRVAKGAEVSCHSMFASHGRGGSGVKAGRVSPVCSSHIDLKNVDMSDAAVPVRPGRRQF